MTRGQIIVAWILTLLAGCSTDRPAGGIGGSTPLDQSEVLGMHLVQYEAGQRTADIEAERGELHSGSGLLLLTRVRGRLLAEDPEAGRRQEIQLEAAQGRASIEGGTMWLSGGVRLRSGEYSVEVPTLEVDRSAKQARSEDRARLTGPGFEARGLGLRVYLDEERLVLLSEVEAKYRGPGGNTP